MLLNNLDLYGNKFTIVSDYKSSQWLFNIKELSSKLVRWRLKLMEYYYNIGYKKRETNADFLKRLETYPVQINDTPDDLLSLFANTSDIADRPLP